MISRRGLKSNKPDDVEKRRTEPEEKSSPCHQAERTHFDCWAGGGGEFRLIEIINRCGFSTARGMRCFLAMATY